jgi:hypothetical protein
MVSRRHTIKNRKNLGFKEEIVQKFLILLNTVKLFHWKTTSFAAHKASDELYSSLNSNIDRFVEVLLGKLNGERVQLTSVHQLPLLDFPNQNFSFIKTEIEKYKRYLVDLDNNSFLKKMSNADLYTIRDEILASLNQFLYLLTFE